MVGVALTAAAAVAVQWLCDDGQALPPCGNVPYVTVVV